MNTVFNQVLNSTVIIEEAMYIHNRMDYLTRNDYEFNFTLKNGKVYESLEKSV
jgi:hypothetical protein